jgi:hypothetical protein
LVEVNVHCPLSRTCSRGSMLIPENFEGIGLQAV